MALLELSSLQFTMKFDTRVGAVRRTTKNPARTKIKRVEKDLAVAPMMKQRNKRGTTVLSSYRAIPIHHSRTL